MWVLETILVFFAKPQAVMTYGIDTERAYGFILSTNSFQSKKLEVSLETKSRNYNGIKSKLLSQAGFTSRTLSP
jgi:hypothetical protein